MARMKAARERERREARLLGRIHGQPHVDAALELARQIGNHWDGCNECQGLAVVEQEPAVADLGGAGFRECQAGPGEVE
jgi:hypothetical protein